MPEVFQPPLRYEMAPGGAAIAAVQFRHDTAKQCIALLGELGIKATVGTMPMRSALVLFVFPPSHGKSAVLHLEDNLDAKGRFVIPEEAWILVNDTGVVTPPLVLFATDKDFNRHASLVKL